VKQLKIKAVILTDGQNYFIHGDNSETPAGMFKKMTAIWDFSPETEIAHYVELDVTLPEFEKTEPVSPHPHDDEWTHSIEKIEVGGPSTEDDRMGLTLNDLKLIDDILT
jgi:hypothetical protein